jgi:hypothetical protein
VELAGPLDSGVSARYPARFGVLTVGAHNAERERHATTAGDWSGNMCQGAADAPVFRTKLRVDRVEVELVW